MKLLFIFLTILVAAYGSMEGGFRVRFDVGTAIGQDFFIDMPKSVPAAVSQGWEAVAAPPSHLPRTVLYCHGNRILCVLYDDTGYAAGIQIAIDPATIINTTAFDWTTQGWKLWEADNGITYWIIQQYFVSEEFLQRSQLDRVQSRNVSKFLQDDAIYVTGFDNQITKIYVDTETELLQTNFTQQSCMSWMGLHYFYNMTADLECTSETVFPWFQLVKDGELIGTGFLLFGNMTINEDRNWFEKPDRAVVETIMPYGPSCAYDLVDELTMNTIHIYYVEQPWTILC